MYIRNTLLHDKQDYFNVCVNDIYLNTTMYISFKPSFFKRVFFLSRFQIFKSAISPIYHGSEPQTVA